MSKKRIVYLVLVGLLFLMGFYSSLYPYSDSLDIVLLIDSSGSMKKNDPSNLRLQAASSFIDLTNVGDQIALVDFSTKSEILSTLRVISEEKDKEELKKYISQIGHTGQKTDILNALKTALQLMKSGSNEDSKRAVVLLTDGELDLPDSSRFFGRPDKGIKEVCESYQKENIGIYSIAFTEKADIGLLDKFVKETNGKLYTAQRAIELFKVYIDIFVDLKKKYRSFQFATDVNLNKHFLREILIDRYVEEITFAVSRSDSKIGIEIRDPEGIIVKKGILATASVAEAPSYKIIRINQPEDGNWSISVKGQGYVLGQVIGTTDFLLNLETSKQYYGPRESIEIEASLMWQGTTFDDLEILEGTEFHLTVTPPDGESIEIQLFDNGKGSDQKEGDGIYSFPYAGRDLEGEYVFYVEAVKKGEFTREKEIRIDRGAVFKILKTYVEREVIKGEKTLLNLTANSSYSEDQIFTPWILTFFPKTESMPSSVEFPALENQRITFQAGKGSTDHVILNTTELPMGIYEGQLQLDPVISLNKKNIGEKTAQLKPIIIGFKIKVVPEPVPPPPPPNPIYLISTILLVLVICCFCILYIYNRRLPKFSGTLLVYESSGPPRQYPLLEIKRGFFKCLTRKGKEIKIGSASSADIRLTGEGIGDEHAVLTAERTYRGGRANIAIYPMPGREIIINNQSYSLSRTLKHDDVIIIGDQKLKYENLTQEYEDDL